MPADSDDLARLLAPFLEAALDLLVKRMAERLGAERRAAPEALLSKQGLATALGVSTATVDRLVKEGRIPFFTVGDVRRFDLAEVREAIRVASSPPVLSPPEEREPPVLVRYGRKRR